MSIPPHAAVSTQLNAIFVSLGSSRSTWLVMLLLPGRGERISRHQVKGSDVPALLEPFAQLQAKARERTGERYPLVVIREAGLEGFGMHPCLIREGIASHVVEAASIAASRRSRRAKTDKPDGQALVRTLLAYRRGELRVCAMVTVPSAEDEDRRRVCRERRSLVVERIRHVIPKRDESVSSRFGQARAALEHFQGLMRQHLRALVSIASRARCLRKGTAITNRCARTGVRGR